MLKKLTQIGTSWGVIIPKATLEFLKINPITDKIEFKYQLDSTYLPNTKHTVTAVINESTTSTTRNMCFLITAKFLNSKNYKKFQENLKKFTFFIQNIIILC